MKTLDCTGGVGYSLVVLSCHKKLINLWLVDISCIVILIKIRYCVFEKLQRRSFDIRIGKGDAGKNEMVTFPDRIVLVWEPKLKSVVLYSFNSEPPSPINLG